MDTVLKGNTGTATLLLTSDGETLVDADGAVTVTVVNDQGTTVQTGTATRASLGTYTLVLQPDEATAELDLLTLSWACDISAVAHVLTTEVEVAGGFHVGLTAIRGTGSGALATAQYPTADLVDGREWWESLAEDYCGRAFVPRYARHTVTFDGTLRLPTPTRSVRWATVAGVTADTTGWTVRRDGLVTGVSAARGQEVVVGVEHGEDAPPSRLADAARTAIRDHLARHASGADRRLSLMNAQGGTERLSYASPERPTGIPEVDAALNNLRVPVVA